MRNNGYQVIATILAIMIANFTYQYFFTVLPNWSDAAERSFFQAMALLIAWLTWRTPSAVLTGAAQEPTGNGAPSHRVRLKT